MFQLAGRTLYSTCLCTSAAEVHEHGELRVPYEGLQCRFDTAVTDGKGESFRLGYGPKVVVGATFNLCLNHNFNGQPFKLRCIRR